MRFISVNNGKIHNDPALYIYGSQIPVVAESKFLGVIFDKKTLLHTPYKILESEMFKSIKPFKKFYLTQVGERTETTLLHLYRSLIRSKT